MTETTTIVPARPRTRKAVVSRAERRELAWREAGKDSHDRLTAAVQQWAAYTGDDGQPPTQNATTYYKAFKRMIHSRLGIPQTIVRDDMQEAQLLALAAMENAVAGVLVDGMAHREPRKVIKRCYAERMDALATGHRPVIALEQVGGNQP